MIELRPDKRVQSHFRKTFPRNLMSAVGQGQPPLRELKQTPFVRRGSCFLHEFHRFGCVPSVIVFLGHVLAQNLQR
jgi:hypothetical protein